MIATLSLKPLCCHCYPAKDIGRTQVVHCDREDKPAGTRSFGSSPCSPAICEPEEEAEEDEEEQDEEDEDEEEEEEEAFQQHFGEGLTVHAHVGLFRGPISRQAAEIGNLSAHLRRYRSN